MRSLHLLVAPHYSVTMSIDKLYPIPASCLWIDAYSVLDLFCRARVSQCIPPAKPVPISSVPNQAERKP